MSCIRLWHDGDARHKPLAGLALGGIGFGAVFYLLFTTWLVLRDRIRDLVDDPPTGSGWLYSGTLLGLGLSFLVIWLAVIHARLRLAGQSQETLDRLDRKLCDRTEGPEEPA